MDKSILVLSGGGIKGLVMLGALHSLYISGYLNKINTYAGSSVGAIISVLLIIGYKPDEIYNKLKKTPFEKLTNVKISNLSEWGLDDGSRLNTFIKELLKNKNYDYNTTFKNLFDKTKKILYITGACLNDKKCYYFSHLETPDLKILDALRISYSVPFYFTHIEHDGKTFVDGSCIDNFPIKLFKDNIEKVIGLYITSPVNTVNQIDSFESYIINLFNLLIENSIIDDYYKNSYIEISYDSHSLLNFNINEEDKEEMFNFGKNIIIDKCRK